MANVNIHARQVTLLAMRDDRTAPVVGGRHRLRALVVHVSAKIQFISGDLRRSSSYTTLIMSASKSRPAELFTPDRALLNPRFETYRLQSLDPSAARGHRLPGEGATQSRVGYGKQQLGFKEVRSRISWDHLDTRGGRGVYVDTEWKVVGFELDVG